MRRIASLAVQWLARRYGFMVLTAERAQNGADPIARGKRWATFYREEGGLKDVIADLRRGYFVKAGHLKPNDLAALQALSLADRILAEIDGTFRVIIVEGEAEEQAQAHADKIAKLPEPKRRRL